jgi:hypothetical protein
MADAPGHHQHQHQHQDLTLQAPADPDDSAVAILSSSKLQTENKIRKPSYGGSFLSAVQLKQYLSVGWEKIQEMQVFNKQQQNQRLGRSRVLAIAAAIFAFLMLVVVLAYQISSGSVSIWPDGADLNDYFHWQTHKKPLNLTFLAGPTFSKPPSKPLMSLGSSKSPNALSPPSHGAEALESVCISASGCRSSRWDGANCMCCVCGRWWGGWIWGMMIVGDGGEAGCGMMMMIPRMWVMAEKPDVG